MDPRDRELLRQTYEITEENNKLLKKLHGSMVWGRVIKIIYWVIIIGSAVGAFYYVEPYLNTIYKIYKSIPTAVNGAQRVIELDKKVNAFSDTITGTLKK